MGQRGTTKAFQKAINHSNITAMSLSRYFLCRKTQRIFLDLVINKLNIIFANEQEIMQLIETKNFKDVIEFARKIKEVNCDNSRRKRIYCNSK